MAVIKLKRIVVGVSLRLCVDNARVSTKRREENRRLKRVDKDILYVAVSIRVAVRGACESGDILGSLAHQNLVDIAEPLQMNTGRADITYCENALVEKLPLYAQAEVLDLRQVLM